MIKNLSIKNYKTIEKLKIELGRVTVLIGENGAGKSNILEAITLAGAACANKLDNEFLQARGIRTSESRLMRSAFSTDIEHEDSPIEIEIKSSDETTAKFILTNDNQPYSTWKSEVKFSANEESIPEFKDLMNDLFLTNNDIDNKTKKEIFDSLRFLVELGEEARKTKPKEGDLTEIIKNRMRSTIKPGNAFFDYFAQNHERMNSLGAPLSSFITFSPENSKLRTEEISTSVEPLGTKGEGLLKLLYVLSDFNDEIKVIKENLHLLGWFSDFSILSETSGYALEIRDSYLENPDCKLDQNSANEGFMFLLFYFTIFASSIGPTFFAVDNIDTSLNPKLCQKLIKQLVLLAKEHDKQVILTTHNPAILDGLNLDDEEQKLYAISRAREGQTKATRIKKPTPLEGAPELRLSEMFLRGLIGGLPKGF